MTRWSLWRRQASTVAALELRRRLGARQLLGLAIAAGVPLALCGARLAAAVLFDRPSRHYAPTMVYAMVYRVLILRFTVFFGCMMAFAPLVRGEILDRSLHYWFLAPVRRSVLVAGKFAAGLAVTLSAFGATTALTWVAIQGVSGKAALAEKLAGPGGVAELLAYLAGTSLACVGYGAVFLAVGVVFRQPIVPALAILGWESIVFLLPAALKNFSVAHHIESLLPVAPPEGPLAIIAAPTSPWIAVPGLVAVAVVAVAFAARRLTRTEILYGGE